MLAAIPIHIYVVVLICSFVKNGVTAGVNSNTKSNKPCMKNGIPKANHNGTNAPAERGSHGAVGLAR